MGELSKEKPSSWSCSVAKRFFDIACIVLCFPMWLPILFFTAIAVCVTSRGPVFFLQKRVGKNNKLFTIIKFRTLKYLPNVEHVAVTTRNSKCLTSIGLFLRHWKLDELPQVLNVLVGDMSLVGARPKLPQHQIGKLQCRPGITGAATIAFAKENEMLANVAKDKLDDFYREIVLPMKLLLDTEYMAQATFFSDLKLIVKSIMRHWDESDICIGNMVYETLEEVSK